MPLSMLVTNQPPDTDDDVPEALKELFHAYTQARDQRVYSIFRHQAEAFRSVDEDREVFLVAGTAAGKTLAVAVPLFHKLATARIRKVLLMYPTIALMEDQRAVMDTLAELTHLEVAQLRGGMSRSQLVAALTKPVIVATPDEVYWFFRKNVKYSSLLIYGLALIDEFVLDEAHLFNGLMLRNFQHLWRRIRTLANSIGKDPRLHILTATPTIALRSLNGAEEIRGQSKCRDVQVELCLAENGGREAQFEKAVDGLLVGGRKILVVCNSARAAHRLFEKHRVDDASTIPAEYRLKFGRAKLGELSAWLEQAGLAKELVDELSRRLLRDEKLALADVPNGTDLKLSLQDVVMRATEVLERQCWLVKRSLWDQSQRPGETWETCLDNRPLPCRIVAALRERLDHAGGPEERQTMVDAWLTDVSERLGNIANDPVHCRAPEFVEITEALISVGLERDLALLLTKRLTFEIRADPGQLPARSLRDRPVYLRSFRKRLG